MRSTIVDALYSPHGYWYIVVSPALTNTTHVITIDIMTGNPLYTGVPFVDVFPDHSIALNLLSEAGCQRKYHGEGLLGLIATETATTIGIIDKTEVTARFPPNHEIHTIRHVSYIHLPTSKNAPKVSIFEDFQLQDNHFICHSYDMTRLFPVETNDNPDFGFVWNCGWRRPFEKLGIPQVCVNLIQGVGVSKEFKKFGFSLAYIARRSVLNPGTRYAARGLNDSNSPGNEVECELLFFKDNKFWSERWRRGSIPIRWKTTLSSKLSSPKHRVEKDAFFNGTAEYFRKLIDRYGEIPIRCVSLLQTEEEHSENEIKGYFRRALEQLFDVGITNVFFTPFDLNQHLHAEGSSEAMMDFLSYIAPLSDGDGFAKGELPNTITEPQHGLMRFNCADSLDRTNLATFYYAMRFTADWCKENKVGLSKTPNADPNQPNKILDQTIIDFLASAFVDSGNVVSRMYTNTPAIKVNAIKKFSPSIVVTQSDTNITLQRRMQNVVNDPIRQKLIELWTKPPELTWFHRLDHNHLFIVPYEDGTQFPRAIFHPSNNQIEITSKQTTVCLPTPMVIFSFMILMYPANQKLKGVTVSGGLDPDHMEQTLHLKLPMVEQATWLRFRPSNSVRWGLESIPDKYVRFLKFEFDSEDDKISIGYIKIEAKSVFCEIPTRIIKTTSIYDDSNRTQFIEIFNDFLKGPMQLDNVIELERLRFSLHISEEFRNRLALEKGISPWLVDSRSQLIAAPKNNICAFCKQPLNEIRHRYCQSAKLPSLISALKPDQQNNSAFSVCDKCNEKAEKLALISEVYEFEFTPEDLPLPHFKVENPRYEMLDRNQVVTNEATAVFMNPDMSLLWKEGGSEIFKQDEEKSYELFVVQQGVFLCFIASTQDDNIDIYDENKKLLHKERINENEVRYAFEEQPITQRLKFSIKAVDHCASLTRLRAEYKRIEFPLEDVALHPNEKLKTGKIAVPPLIESSYDPLTRTETIRPMTSGKIVAMQVEMVTKGASYSLSFYLGFYNNNKELIQVDHFILPEATHGSMLWYNIGGITADTVKVFYADRVAAFKPHNIRFVIE